MLDPSLIFAAANLMQQRNLANYAAQSNKYELDEFMRQEMILEERRQIRESISKQAMKLLQLVSRYPKETLVITRIRMYELEIFGVFPDNFENLGDKEKAALLWRKLSNILERCMHELNEDMQQECTRCLDAASLQFFVLAISEKLDAYNCYLSQKLRYYKYKAMRKYSLIFVWMFPFVMVAASYFIGISNMKLSTMVLGLPLGDILVLSGICLEVIMIGFYNIINTVYYNKEKLIHDSLVVQANVENSQFWQDVTKQFDGIPTTENLQICWDEQAVIINKFLKDMPPLVDDYHE